MVSWFQLSTVLIMQITEFQVTCVCAYICILLSNRLKWKILQSLLIEKNPISSYHHICSTFFQQLSRGVYEGCQDAVYNLKVVTSCPKSKEEWNIASSIKNCTAIAAVAKKKNCTIDDIHPKYHCVINAFRNKFLEVCADEKTIFGNIWNLFFKLFNRKLIIKVCCYEYV